MYSTIRLLPLTLGAGATGAHCRRLCHLRAAARGVRALPERLRDEAKDEPEVERRGNPKEAAADYVLKPCIRV